MTFDTKNSIWVLAIDGHYWNGRGPVVTLHATEDEAKAALYAYVKRNWDGEMNGAEMPEDEEDAVIEYFDAEPEHGESYKLGATWPDQA